VKYFIVCIIVFTSGYIGKLFAEKYKNRVNFYGLLLKFADFLVLNIYHLHDDILNIIEKFIENNKSKYSKDLLLIKSMIKNDYCSTDQIGELKLCRDLNDIEIKEFCEFINLLGKSNLSSQVNIISNYKSIFESKYNEALGENKQKGTLLNKISISIGVLFCIIIL